MIKQPYLTHGLHLLVGSLLMLGTLASCTGFNASLVSGSPSEEDRTQDQASGNFLQQELSPERLRKRQLELAQFRSKPAYLGPISVNVNTGRISGKQGAGKVVDLSRYIAEQATEFSVQAVPDGPVVFQEQFTKSQGDVELTRFFPTAKLGIRYTLYVERLNENVGSVEVNVNGTDWILAQDFAGLVKEVQRDALLLNSSNSLRVRLKGNPGFAVKVTLVEGGQAGTILRRQGQLGKPGETHQTHLQQNAVNIFNPNNPNSLGELTPFAGVEKIETDQKVYEFSELAINGVPIRIENARMLMVFRDDAKKQAFLETWHAEIESEESGMCLVKFDLSKAPLQNLDTLLRNANTLMTANITDVSVSSFDGLRTFAIILDVLKNYGDDYFYADPNFKLEGSAGLAPAVMPTDWDDGLQSWWLQDTNVLNAWNYSIGTGIRVAWLDNGTDFANRGHTELKRRTDVNPFFGNLLRFTGGDALASIADHSLSCQMVGFAERGNFAKTAGVAPNATVIPYNVLTHSDKAMDSLKAVGAASVHVLGSSYGCWNCRDDVFRFFENQLVGGDALSDTIDYIINSLGIPYINSSGNGGSKQSEILFEKNENGIHVNKNIPRGDVNNLIMVGAVAPPAGRATNFYPSLSTHEITFYSNYGENVIYAPGEDIQVADPSDPSKLSQFNGTSAAAPFITGVVSLMLSRNPELTPSDILDILKNSSKKITQPEVILPTFYVPDSPSGPATFPSYAPNPLDLRLIDVEEAVKQAIVKAGQTPALATEHYGIISVNDVGSKRLLLNNSTDLMAPTSQRIQRMDLQTVDTSVWNNLKDATFVKLRGWSDSHVGKLHLFPFYSASMPRAIAYQYNETPIKLSDSDFELLDAEVICNIPINLGVVSISCAAGSTFSPVMTKLEFHQSGVRNVQTLDRTKDTEIEIQGASLWINNVSPVSKAILKFHQVDPTTGNEISPANIISFPFSPLGASNDGTSVKLKLSAAELGTIANTGDYKLSFTGLTGSSSLVGFNASATSSGASFSVKSNGGNSCDLTLPPEDCSTPGYNIASIKPSNAPPHISLWVVRDTQRLAVKPEYVVGVAINDQDLSQLQVLIKDGNTTIQANVVEIAQNFAAFKIPVGAQAGVKDLLLKIGAQQVLMEDALDLQPADAVTAQFDQPSVYVYEKGNVVVKVRKPDGTTYPDGTPIYVYVAGPGIGTQHGPGVASYHPDGSPAGSNTYYLTNGEVKFKVAAETRIPPSMMDGENWPDWRSGHPNFEIRDVCLGAYSSSSGWHCSTRIGPTNPDEQPRLYVRDAYWVEGKREIPVQSGQLGYSQTLRIFDRAGIPVPNGSAMFFDGGYFSSFSISPVTTGNEITVGITSQGAPCWGAEAGKPGVLEGIILRSIYSLYPQVGDRLRNMDRTDEYSLSIRYFLGPGCN